MQRGRYLGPRTQLSRRYGAMRDSSLDVGAVGHLYELSEDERAAWYKPREEVLRKHPCCAFWHEPGAPRRLRRFEHVAFGAADVFRALGNNSTVAFGGDSVSVVGREAALCGLVASGAVLTGVSFRHEEHQQQWQRLTAEEDPSTASFCHAKLADLLRKPSRHTFILPGPGGVLAASTTHSIEWARLERKLRPALCGAHS